MGNIDPNAGAGAQGINPNQNVEGSIPAQQKEGYDVDYALSQLKVAQGILREQTEEVRSVIQDIRKDIRVTTREANKLNSEIQQMLADGVPANDPDLAQKTNALNLLNRSLTSLNRGLDQTLIMKKEIKVLLRIVEKFAVKLEGADPNFIPKSLQLSGESLYNLAIKAFDLERRVNQAQIDMVSAEVAKIGTQMAQGQTPDPALLQEIYDTIPKLREEDQLLVMVINHLRGEMGDKSADASFTEGRNPFI